MLFNWNGINVLILFWVFLSNFYKFLPFSIIKLLESKTSDAFTDKNKNHKSGKVEGIN